MKSSIRVLHLEDSPLDADLIQHNLLVGGLACDIVLVSGKQGFESAVAKDSFDVILCDHNMPGYDGRSALKLALEKLPAVPVIILSGTVGEEEAVECLRLGATDYVLMHRLERLVPAVRRASQEVKERRARLKAEVALRESEEQFRAMFEVASIGIAQSSPQTGQFLRVNQKMCAITGYSTGELLRMRVSDLTHTDDRQKDKEQFERVVRGEASDYRMEKRYVRKDGAVAWVNVNMTVIRDAAGQPSRTLAAIEDITERKRAEAALCQNEAELAEARRLAKYGNWSWDISKDKVTWSNELYGIFGVEKKDFPHNYESFFERVDPVEREAMIAASRKARTEGGPFEIVYGISTPDGEKRVIRERGYAIRDEAGRVVRLVGTAQDITAEKQAEAALRQKEEYFRALTERATDVTTLFDADGTMRYESPSVEQVLGYKPDELVGRSALAFIHPEDLARVRQALAETIAVPGSTTRIELRFRHKQGSWRVLEATTRNLLDNPNVKGIVVNSRDITERKQLEEALRESSQFNQQIIANAQEGIIVYGRDLKYQVWNPFMEQLSGIPAHKVLGMHPDELFPFLREAGVLAAIEKALAGETTSAVDFHFEGLPSGKSGWTSDTNGPLRNTAGEIIGAIGIVRDITERKRAEESHARLVTAVEQSVETIVVTDTTGMILYANPAFEKTSGYTRAEALGQNPRILKSGKHDAEFYHQMWTTLGRGEVWSGRLINKRKDGTLYEEDATISPVRDPAGKVVNYVAVKRDVTREAQLEAQLRQSQKMEAVGQLAGGVAHDFNNMLAVIRGNAELLLIDETQFTDEVRGGLKHVVDASERAANLTRQLLAFSRKQVLQPQPLLLNEVIANLTKMLNRVISENIKLQCHCAPPLPYVQADTSMMEQVILNLVVNARDAMPEGGQLRIATERLSFNEAHARTHPEARAGEFVCVTVCDTGIGIAPEVLPNIFEPFFTTKEVGKGTGLGLATVYGIVQQHQGWIEVSSQVGEGTTFRVFLPAIPTPARLPAAAGSREDVRGGKEMILLVEDDHAVRLTTRRVLESKGYAIREATSAQEALEQWYSHTGEIALLLTDIIMTGEMTGRDLAEHLWAERPGLKVIFMSGYSADVMGKNTQFLRRTRSHFLQKPCPSWTLLETVRRCLDEKEPMTASAGTVRPK